MRCTQIVGLPDIANQWLDKHCEREPTTTCKTCGHTTGGGLISEVYNDASHTGMFDDGPELYKYKLKTGGYVYETVQATPWSSGPVIFLQLVSEDGCVLVAWSGEEIANA